VSLLDARIKLEGSHRVVHAFNEAASMEAFFSLRDMGGNHQTDDLRVKIGFFSAELLLRATGWEV